MQAQKKTAREEMDGATKAREALRSQVALNFLQNSTMSKQGGCSRWSNVAVPYNVISSYSRLSRIGCRLRSDSGHPCGSSFVAGFSP